MKIECEKFIEHEDGSATVTVVFDEEALWAMVKVGLLSAIEKAVNGHLDTEGSGDPSTGEDGDPPVHGEFPGF